MAALCAAHHAVRAHHDIAVKVHIDLEGRENHEVKLVDISALIEGVRVFSRRDVVVVRIGRRALNRVLVKVLGVHKRARKALFEELAHRLRDAAHTEAHVDVPLAHHIGERDGTCNRCAAHAGLVGEAVLKVGRALHDLGAVACHEELSLVGGRLCRARCDLRGIADFIDHDHIVHVNLADLVRPVREGNQAVRDCDHLVRIERIRRRVGEHAAVCLAAVCV